MKNLGRWLVVGVATAAMAFGVLALSTPTQAAPGCICPMVYAPVKCSNGKTYSNLCVASCNRATGCVPLPGYPPPIQ
jgi:hypothetical protein